MSDAFNAAVTAQRMAADPSKNVFVAANAGSGKTRVLVDRVIRLLLEQAKRNEKPRPDKIVCLTYTKAAASEMQSRLFERLGAWSVMDDVHLVKALDGLDGLPTRRPPEELAIARRLFAQALETPEGLKVQTIHAFCERLLRRFPVEAQIAPGYDMIDDQTRAQMVTQIKSALFKRALDKPDGALAAALNVISLRNAQTCVDELVNWACNNAHRVLADGPEAGERLRARFDITSDESAKTLMRAAHEATNYDMLRGVLPDLDDGSKTNEALRTILIPMLSAPDNFEAFAAYYDSNLTQKGTLKTALSAGKTVQDIFGTVQRGNVYGHEGARLFALNQALLEVDLVELTETIFTLAVPAAKLYGRLKTERRLLDFSDLIEKARALLVDSASRDWVRYKLDQGADHVLVDEAQDTAGDQWAIINALSEEFGATLDDGRTRFAVGDEKQSIYGFQGAEPKLFLQQGQQNSVDDPRGFEAVSLKHSFRSAGQVLEFVDSIFVKSGAITQVYNYPPGGDIAEHKAIRADAGRVELWPLTRVPETQEIESAWDAPLDHMAEQSSREQLAQIIAKSVKTWLDEGHGIWDVKAKSTRAMQPGDIMILLRSRSAFFHAVIRNLKKAGVAVAGADRLKLPDNIGVQDLVSLGKFLALPSDDLSLAEVLRSPIFGLPEQGLMALAINRDGTLFEAVIAAPFPEALEIRATLNKWIRAARDLPPYEFYAQVLAHVFDSDKTSVMARFEGRLGAEARDPIEAFLSRALEHQRRGAPSLDGFLHDFETYQSELKREADSGGNEVRVMTVHGAKGLESPVVILPDTYDLPADRGPAMIPQDLPEAGWAGKVSKEARPLSLEPDYMQRDDDMTGEYLRLLYVAMTRAETRLICCGYESGSRGKDLKIKEGSWYDWMSRGFAALDDVRKEPHDVFGAVQIYGAQIERLSGDAAEDSLAAVPQWAKSAPRSDAPPPRHVSPSHLLAGPQAALPASRSPLDVAREGHDRFERGRRIHKLLEILPDIDPARRRDVAEQFLTARDDMSRREIDDMVAEIFAVLEHKEFAHIFAQGSQAEVSLAGQAEGLPAGIYINGQVDRITVTDSEVWIIDYKSNRPAPTLPGDVSAVYLAQMAAYRALARAIYPGKAVRCALLWTEQAHLMELPADLLDGINLSPAALKSGAGIPNSASTY